MKKKLNLEKLIIKSFVTKIDTDTSGIIKGGTADDSIVFACGDEQVDNSGAFWCTLGFCGNFPDTVRTTN